MADRWSVALLIAGACLLAPGRVAAQANGIKSVVSDSLRARVGAQPVDTLYIERTYARSFFPGATFYRVTYYLPGTWHYPERRAAAVVVGTTVRLVATPDDVGPAWMLALEDNPLSPSFYGAACRQFLKQVGMLSMSAHVVETRHQLSAEDSATLVPKGRAAIQNKQVVSPGGAVRVVSTVLDRDLLVVTCYGTSTQMLDVTIDTLALRRP